MRLSLPHIVLVSGLLNLFVPQEAGAAPMTPAIRMILAPVARPGQSLLLSWPVLSVYYYGGHYYRYRYRGHYYQHRDWHNGHWHYH